MGKCCRGHGPVPETSDKGKIGRHHRDLPKLGQRKGHRKLQRLGQLEREAVSSPRREVRRDDRCSLDFIKGCQCDVISIAAGPNSGGHLSSRGASLMRVAVAGT